MKIFLAFALTFAAFAGELQANEMQDEKFKLESGVYALTQTFTSEQFAPVEPGPGDVEKVKVKITVRDKKFTLRYLEGEFGGASYNGTTEGNGVAIDESYGLFQRWTKQLEGKLVGDNRIEGKLSEFQGADAPRHSKFVLEPWSDE